MTSGGGNSQPSISPDSSWIVYTSTRGGKSTLWGIAVDGGEATQLTGNHSSVPQISPDGKFIAYARPTDLYSYEG